MARWKTCRWRRSSFSEPNGCALCSSMRAVRRSFGSDSGRMKQPYRKLHSARPAATQNGSRSAMPPRKPPTPGPMMKPSPNALPRMPNAAARFSFGTMSAMYALAVLKLAAVMPSSTRAANSSHSVGASASTTKSTARPRLEIRITDRRP